MNWLARVNPCPLCGNKEKITRTEPDNYRNVKKACGSGLVAIECHRCNVRVVSFGFEVVEAGIPNNYRNVFSDVLEKWNRLTEGRKA